MSQPPIRKSLFAILELTQGYCALVDKSNWPKVRKFCWHVHHSRGKNKAKGEPYARACINGKKVYLHRFLTNCPPGFQVDHKNHQTLDCRTLNLEVVTNTVNMARRRCSKKKS